MSRDFQHCPDCEEEYVAGVPACVECGKPLVAGPLPHFEGGGGTAAPAATAAAAGGDAGAEVFLVELPGLDAHEAVQALLLERIPCRATCKGLDKTYTPERPPQGPLATSLAVRLHVGTAHLEAAHEIIDSLRGGDLIGEQWSEAPHPDALPDEEGDEANAESPPTESPVVATLETDADPTAGAPLQAEGSGGRTIMLLVAVAIIVALVLALGRQ